MQFSDEELIAYLLGDASPELSQRIQQQLPVEPQLLGRLTEFRVLLGQIDSIGSFFEPPADLVDGTLARIDAVDDDSLGEAAQGDAAESRLGESCDDVVESRLGESCDDVPVLLSSRIDALPRRSSVWDSTALTISLTVLCCLALPALVRVRFESRRAQCARNLSITGSELINYALNHPQNRFPRVALEGPEAFAGVYAVTLQDAGAKLSPAQLRCASLIGTGYGVSGYGVTSPSSSPQFARTIPSFSELHRFAVHELSQWQQAIGGDYAYNLGVSEQGSIQAPKCEGRSQFALLSDAPVIIASLASSQPRGDTGQLLPRPRSSSQQQFSGGQNGVKDDEYGDSDKRFFSGEQFIAHEGRGINIFYEDGRVVFVTTASLHQSAPVGSRLADNPLHNQRGVHEVGLHPQDASLAPSHFPPLAR